MTPFSLEEYLKNPSRKVVTRDGRAVKIYCTDYMDKFSRFVIAKIEGNAYSYSFREDGRFVDHKETDNDLFFASEKHEGWINIFRGKDNPFTGNIIFASKEEAEESGRHCCGFTKDLYMTSAKIEWEE